MATIIDYVIDNTNYLTIDLKHISNDKPEFEKVITELEDIRVVLQHLESIERLSELAAYSKYYIQALQWLKGELTLTNPVRVNQVVGGYKNASPTIIAQFDNYVAGLHNKFRTNQLFNIQEILLTMPQKTIDTMLNKAKKHVSTITDEHVINIQNLGNEQINNINDQSSQARNNIIAEANNQINQIKQVKAMTGWTAHYEEVIMDCKIRLYGKASLPHLFWRNFQSLQIKRRDYKQRKIDNSNSNNNLKPKRCYRWIRNFVSLLSCIWSKISSYRFQRFFWFTLLASVLIIAATAHITGWFQFSISTQDPWYSKYIIYLPFITIFSVGYSFAIKNYRIYHNRLEQYEHRRAVAATASDIITSLPGAENEKVRDNMSTTAAKALFEHKSTGHLSKKEAESGSIFEIIRAIKG